MTLSGHPDKACDLVAEAIVDEYLRRDPETRIRVHVTGGRGALFVAGDVRSQADFDVSSVVRRTLGELGVASQVEPFISLETIAPEHAPIFVSGAELPITVAGYATAETPEYIPAPLSVAKQLAKKLDELRRSDESWFWLGPDTEIVVYAEKSQPSHVYIHIEHAGTSLEEARSLFTKFVHTVVPQISVRVNELGVQEERGLAYRMGASGRDRAHYGESIPFHAELVGRDMFHAEKAGSWLARAAARALVLRGAGAALVHLMYLPGVFLPARIVARDEKGRDLSAQLHPELYSLERVWKEWWRPGLNMQAARWGFAGEPGLPWEE